MHTPGPAASSWQPAAPTTRLGGDFLPSPLARLLKTAQQEIDRHVNDHGRCAACASAAFPCERATLADLALAGL